MTTYTQIPILNASIGKINHIMAHEYKRGYVWLQITTRSEITLIYQRLLIYGHQGDISCENMLILYIMLAYFYNILYET